MTNKDEKRSVQFLIRITPSEYLEIKKNTSESGLCMSEYARRLITGETIVAAPPADLNYLIREIKRVGSNLNQLLRKLNVLGVVHTLELERCITDVHEVLKLITQTYRPGKGDD